MTLATQEAPMSAPPAKETGAMEYIPFGAEDKIKLSTSVVRNLIATPTKDGDLPDDRECFRFMMLCRAGRLNPFAGDAYLIGFFDRYANAVKWSLITAIHAYYKRAESHPEYDGIESGVIVKDKDGNEVDRTGDFTRDDDTLLGAWATVHFKSRSHPTRRRMKLGTYKKEFGVWKSDPAGMICKVAEAHALRDSFPTLLGGFYLREEIEATHERNPDAPPPPRPGGRTAALLSKVTQRPVSEGQTFVPDGEAAAKLAAEQVIENAPRATENDEQPAKSDDIDTSNVKTWPKMQAAMFAIAARDNVEDGVRDNALRVIGVKDKGQWPGIVEAAKAGAFDWSKGEVVG